MGILEKMREGEHEEVVFHYEPVSGLRAVVVIHNTALGPALGGTRMYPYPSEEEAVGDALRLAQAMTYKSAVAGLDVGGGKAIIIADPAQHKTEPLLRAYGRLVHSLGGRYITTTDVGTTTADMDIIRRETCHVTGYSTAFGGSGDTSILTALTIYLGMKASVRQALGVDSLRGLRVAVQGVGKVGWHLLEHLTRDGCRIYAADVDSEALERAVQEAGATPVPADEIYDVECDVFSPNSLGGLLNDETIPRLRCRIVCGGANSPLAQEHHADALAQRGILFAPDFVVNSGGVINAANELWGYDAQRAQAMAQKVYDTTLAVFALAKEHGVTPLAAARRLAEERIRAAGGMRHYFVPSPAAKGNGFP
ncbi:MAG: Leu/Phe/Val dehydrogenase [Dehalococcoidia bacterium]